MQTKGRRKTRKTRRRKEEEVEEGDPELLQRFRKYTPTVTCDDEQPRETETSGTSGTSDALFWGVRAARVPGGGRKRVLGTWGRERISCGMDEVPSTSDPPFTQGRVPHTIIARIVFRSTGYPHHSRIYKNPIRQQAVDALTVCAQCVCCVICIVSC